MERHLQLLLKEVNTVIVPDLGALTVTNESTGELMFMPFLKFDDGKLSAFIAEKENCTENEAKQTISEFVQRIFETIKAGKKFSLMGLGTFSSDASGDIEFFGQGENVQDSEISSGGNVPNTDPAMSSQSADEEYSSSSIQETKTKTETVGNEMPEDLASPQEIADGESFSIDVQAQKRGFFGFFKKNKKQTGEVGSLPSDAATTSSAEHAPHDELTTSSFAEEKITKQSVPEELKDSAEIISPEKNEMKVEDAQVGDQTDPVVDGMEPSEGSVGRKEEVVEQMPVLDLSSDEEESSINNELLDEGRETKSFDEEDSDGTGKVLVKKRRGASFWILMFFIVAVLGGGVFVALNYDKMEKYNPFLAAKKAHDEIPEDKLIKDLESDKTTPGKMEESDGDDLVQNSDPSSPKDDNSLPTAKPNPAQKTTPKNNPTVTSSSTGPFYVVLASFGEQANAGKYIAQIRSKGASSASILERDGKYVACFGGYESKSLAISNLNDAKVFSPNAWVLHKP